MKIDKAVVCTYGEGYNALGIARSLGSKGIKIIMVGLKNHRNIAYRSKYCTKKEFLKTLSLDDIVQKLDNLSALSKTKPLLFIDNDYMIDLLKDELGFLENSFYLTQNLSSLVNKEVQMDYAQKAKNLIPKTFSISNWDEIEKINIDPNIKIIMKPLNGSKSKPFKILIGKNLSDSIHKLSRVVDSPKEILFQEYIEGNEEEGDSADIWICIGYRSFYSDHTIAMTGIKYKNTPREGGVMAIGKMVESENLVNIARKLIEEIDYRGIFGIEYKYSKKDNSFYFIEMSTRTELFHTISNNVNIDLPYLAFLDHLNENKIINIQPNYVINNYWISIRNILQSYISAKSIYNIKDLLIALFSSNKSWQVFNRKDIVPFLISTNFLLKDMFYQFINKFSKTIKHING